MCTLLCVCPPRVESLFPPVLSKSCNQIPLAFKVWFSRNSSSRCRTPRFGSLTWVSEPSLQWVDFCGISVLQFVSHPPSSYRIWFYCDCAPPTVSLWLLLCLWMWGIFFGEFQCLPVDDCSAVSCDSGALSRGNESTSFYYTILNQSQNCFLSCFMSCESSDLPSGACVLGGCIQKKLPDALCGLLVSESTTTLGVGWSIVMPGDTAWDSLALPSPPQLR